MSLAKEKCFLATITGSSLRGITNFITSSKRVIEQKIYARIPRIYFHNSFTTSTSKILAVYNFTTVPSYPVILHHQLVYKFPYF